jgi:hypothetical protein
VRIRPAEQAVISLGAEGDAAHQITLSFQEPKDSRRLPRDNTSSIPVYTVIVNTLAIGASVQEYSTAVVNSTYQFLLRIHGLQPHHTDMGRCVLMSLKARRKRLQLRLL